jgi:hypothetical protein
MKKYIFFEHDYDAMFGGIGDIMGTTDEPSEAVRMVQESTRNKAYIVNRDTWEIWIEKEKGDNSG